jgi:RNA polymerase sigma factor (TIGR02999 family)
LQSFLSRDNRPPAGRRTCYNCRHYRFVKGTAMADVTQILSQIESGDPTAAEQLLPLVYDELRNLAAARLAQEKPGQTLQATALVHEAFLRLVGTQQWDSRGHFFAAAAEGMRRILVDIARHKRSQKAGMGMKRVDLGDITATLSVSPDDLLALDEALIKLAGVNPEAANVAKLRLFAGLEVAEAAENLGLSRRTGFRQWTYARAFLQAELKGAGK